uniref:Uncharacterized protein n=1 Tax=Prolemur simus TaxID=1328070 RepID=A0A8C8Z839_PROSS
LKISSERDKSSPQFISRMTVRTVEKFHIHPYKSNLISNLKSFSFFSFLFFFLRQGLTPLPELECSGIIIAHCNLKLLGSSNHPASPSQVGRTAGTCHHTHRDGVSLRLSRTPDLERSTRLGLPEC